MNKQSNYGSIVNKLGEFYWPMQASILFQNLKNTFGGINVGSFSPLFCLRSFSPSFSWPPIWSTHCSASETVICYFGYVGTTFSEAALKKKIPFPHWIPCHIYIWDSELISNIICCWMSSMAQKTRTIYTSMATKLTKNKQCTIIYVNMLHICWNQQAWPGFLHINSIRPQFLLCEFNVNLFINWGKKGTSKTARSYVLDLKAP